MDLIDAHLAGQPILIDHPDGGRRVCAELFRHPQGVVFADIGWPEATSHPFHLVEGAVRGEGPWTVGESRFVVLTESDRELEEWLAWRQIRETRLQYADRALAAEMARRDGFLVTE